MKPDVLFETELVLLVLFSLVVPAAVYAFLYHRTTISRWSIMGYAILLIVLAGIDFALLQSLTEQVRAQPALPHPQLFTDQVALVLYLLPAAFAGLGINMLSHVLTRHLDAAEYRFDRRSAQAGPAIQAVSPDAGVSGSSPGYRLIWGCTLAAGAIFAADVIVGAGIHLHALYLFPLALLARRSDNARLVTGAALITTALQVLTFSLEAEGIASFMTDVLISISASALIVMLARRRAEPG